MLEIAHNVNEWFCIEILPNIKLMAISGLNNYPKSDVEYWHNAVVKFVLESVENKFLQKRNTKARFKKILLHEAEIICLYRFLLKYPVDKTQVWKVSQLQFIIAQLDQHIKSIVI